MHGAEVDWRFVTDPDPGLKGVAQDSRAVVDERLRVYGSEGLRVVDASITPALVSGNTNASTFMIGDEDRRYDPRRRQTVVSQNMYRPRHQIGLYR